MPAPPIIQFGHLSLPAYKIGSPQFHNTGTLSSGLDFWYSTGTLVSRATPWQAFAIKSADAGSVPILYTPAFLPALRQPNVLFPSADPNNNKVVLATTPAFGAKSSVVRLPRMVTLPTFGAGSGQDLANAAWAAANASWLTPNFISVVQLEGSVWGFGYENGKGNLVAGMPLTGVTIIGDSFGQMAAAVVDPTTFVGGMAYEIRQFFFDYTDNGFVGSGFASNQAAADVATNQAIYSRFAKRKVVCFSTTSFNPAINNFHAGLLPQLSGYGFDATLHTPGTFSPTNSSSAGIIQAFLDTQTSAIKSFFGIS